VVAHGAFDAPSRATRSTTGRCGTAWWCSASTTRRQGTEPTCRSRS